MAALLCLLCFCLFFSFLGEWAGDTTMRGSGAWEVLPCSTMFELVSVYLGGRLRGRVPVRGEIWCGCEPAPNCVGGVGNE